MLILRNALFKSCLFISVLYLLPGCNSSENKILEESVGKPGSLVIVSDVNTLKGLKSELENTFTKPLAELPAVEPFFEILQPDIADFTKFYYNQRTVLVLVTESNYGDMKELLEPFPKDTVMMLIKNVKVSLRVQRNMFAKHQHIVYLFGNDAKDLKKRLSENKNTIVNSLIDFELNDQSGKLYDNAKENTYYNTLKNKYGIGVRIPEQFKIKKESNNFYWFQLDTSESGNTKSIGLMVHSYPYKDTSDFSYISITSMRDSFCKYNIQGELKGTYMSTTGSTFYPPRSIEMIKLSGYNTAKVRGWWTIKGVSMAGPFIRYVVHIPEKNLLFVFEGFVYSANLNVKERDLRTIEAIALSIH